jgi:hypothetical protein
MLGAAHEERPHEGRFTVELDRAQARDQLAVERPGLEADEMGPEAVVRPEPEGDDVDSRTMVSSVAVRMNWFTADTHRNISSTAVGMSSGSSIRGPWSG